MNSLIFISPDPKVQEKYLEDFYISSDISPFDRQKIAEEGSIGVEVIRKMQTNLYLAPYQGTKKSIVINNAQTLTIEAQNALLKVLEEPPAFVYLILLATTREQFLPTIISRCKVVIQAGTVNTKPEDIQKVYEQIDALQHASVGEKLSLAENIAREKEQLASWFGTTTTLLRASLIEHVSNPEKTQSTLALLKKLEQAHKEYQTTNISPRIILEHTFLAL